MHHLTPATGRLDVVRRQAGDAAHDAGFAVVEFDGKGGIRDQDGDGLMLADAAEGDPMPADHDDAGVRGAALDSDRFGARARRWPSPAQPTKAPDLIAGERVGSSAQQFTSLQIEEHQRCRLDANVDPAPAEDLRQDLMPGQGHDPAGLTERSNSTAPPDHAGEVERATDVAVAGLRRAGYSWAEIASCFGVTRQAAQQRWADTGAA